MTEPINNSSSISTAALQSANIAEQEAQKRREVEEQNNQEAPSSNQVSVSVTVGAVTPPEETADTKITDSEEAEATAANVVSLFQEQPELAATAQGGNVTSEKVDAYLKAVTQG